MANKRLSMSMEGKLISDDLVADLGLERPSIFKIAFATGINTPEDKIYFPEKGDKWTMPEGIIRGEDYLLIKHIIINEHKANLSDDEIQDYLVTYIETGLRILKEKIESKSSLEDTRIAILN